MVSQGSSVSIHKKFKCWIHLNNFLSFSWRHLLSINQSVRETKGISSFVVRSWMWLQSQDQKEILYSQCLPTPCLPTHHQFLYCNLDGSAVCRYFIFSAVQFYIWSSTATSFSPRQCLRIWHTIIMRDCLMFWSVFMQSV